MTRDRTLEQQCIIDAVCERLRKDTERRLAIDPPFGVRISLLRDDGRVGETILTELKKAVPGPWPEEKPVVKSWLDGSVLHTRITMQAGPVADQLARAGFDVRCEDGTPYVPFDEEIIITVQEIKRDL